MLLDVLEFEGFVLVRLFFFGFGVRGVLGWRDKIGVVSVGLVGYISCVLCCYGVVGFVFSRFKLF